VCPDRATVRGALREHAASQQRGPRRGSKRGRKPAVGAGYQAVQHSVWPLARQRTSYCSAPEPPIEGTHSQSVSA
jgi:hypothetical protein